MDWRIIAAGIPALLAVWAGVSLPYQAQPDMAVLRNGYRRPPEIPFPVDNPYSNAKAELGRKLFFDPLLSGSGATSCGSCHAPELAWGDGRPRAVGAAQTPLPFRSPTLLATAWIPRLGWDGKFRDIEAVTFGPINSPSNMNLATPVLLSRLSSINGYVDAFVSAFGEGEITGRKIELALATFERSIIPGEAAFDRWIEGDASAIGANAQRGFSLFVGKGRCAECHNGYAFTDGSFHDIGTAEGGDIGRGRLFPSSIKLRYAFKTPTLRDVARRAPYMHDGSIPTLDAVINLYDKGGTDRPSRSVLIGPLGLTEEDKTDLVAFLETLTSQPESFAKPVLPR